jgi:hypothetical protein
MRTDAALSAQEEKIFDIFAANSSATFPRISQILSKLWCVEKVTKIRQV